MARRPLPRILTSGSAQLTRSRELARTAADGATDVLQPLITLTRGLHRLAGAGRRRWRETPKDRRGPLLFLAASVVLVVVLVPYGPLLAGAVLMAAAAWHGRDRHPKPTGPDPAEAARLGALYEALVPYFSVPEDPEPLYSHGGDWTAAFAEHDFDEDGRPGRLVLRYPAYFADGDADARAGVEQLLATKAGRGREYHFGWDEAGNRLTVTALAPLSTGIAAQRFVTAPGETVLGFTDPTSVQRTLPVADAGEQRDVPPVVWRTGPRSTEPHLLAVGQPGSGTSTLLRSIALQALRHGDVLIVEGAGAGEYAFLAGRPGVIAVECSPAGALSGLEWAARETERRLIEANRARQAGQAPPPDTRRPLWILVDRPSVLGHLAALDGRPDPQAMLQVPLRHGRAAAVTVVVADQFDGLEALHESVLRHTRARAVLGPAPVEAVGHLLGARPGSAPAEPVPAGRGFARLGAGPLLRLQVPGTPDPFDEAAPEPLRTAVLALLPEHPAPAEEADGVEQQLPAEADPFGKEGPAAAGGCGTVEEPGPGPTGEDPMPTLDADPARTAAAAT
ncbi:hypothetical protein [Streptomyces sp. NPDC058045]|uniref:hypothetical protein n=1 Tax=Streptomyces sp. NPDC058045 TaxID=3346311 RepID=UPI0036E8D979